MTLKILESSVYAIGGQLKSLTKKTIEKLVLKPFETWTIVNLKLSELEERALLGSVTVNTQNGKLIVIFGGRNSENATCSETYLFSVSEEKLVKNKSPLPQSIDLKYRKPVYCFVPEMSLNSFFVFGAHEVLEFDAGQLEWSHRSEEQFCVVSKKSYKMSGIGDGSIKEEKM